jgi:DNA-binding NtrC family response regulator
MAKTFHSGETSMSTQVQERAPTRVLLVDGEGRSGAVLQRVLETTDNVVDVANTMQEAVHGLEHQPYDVVVIDLDRVGLEGFRELAQARAADSVAQFLALTDRAAEEVAVEATRLGAFGYVMKPLDPSALLTMVERTRRDAEQRRGRLERQEQSLLALRSKIIGRSAAMDRMFEMIERVAATRATVLVLGETGTGKELVARGIHQLSERASGPFVPVNCSALPETLLESELFGHTRGSFTGAIANRRGLFEDANGGTLFLDEISTISPSIQVKLLRVLQDHQIQRVGGGAPIKADFRLIAATNVDLAQEVSAGRFREDLFYRLNVFPIEVPPLRQRAGDIPLLVSYFRLKFSRENDVPAPVISPETLARLAAYNWPGNVRELENFMERSVIMHAGRSAVRFDPPLGEQADRERSLLRIGQANHWDLARLEREYIQQMLESCNGHRAEAAALLGIDRRTLYRKLKEYEGDARGN